MKEHPLVVVIVVLIGDLLLPVDISLPQFFVHHLLDLQSLQTDVSLMEAHLGDASSTYLLINASSARPSSP